MQYIYISCIVPHFYVLVCRKDRSSPSLKNIYYHPSLVDAHPNPLWEYSENIFAFCYYHEHQLGATRIILLFVKFSLQLHSDVSLLPSLLNFFSGKAGKDRVCTSSILTDMASGSYLCHEIWT